jgi:hypothetical protein
MIRDQNRIELQRHRSVYEEYTLDPNEQGLVLPGSLVCVKEAATYEGSTILGSGGYDGVYRVGDPLFAVQTPNGIYVGTEPSPFMVDMAEESCVITANQVDEIDTSNSDYSDWHLNGKTVNLVRTRIRTARLLNVSTGINYSVIPTDAGTYNDYNIVFTFLSELTDELTESALTFTHANIVSDSLIKIDETHYAVKIHILSGSVSVVVSHPEITTSQKPVPVIYYPESTWILTPTNVDGTTTALTITLSNKTAEHYGGLFASEIDVTGLVGTTGSLTKLSATQYLLPITPTAGSTVSVTITKDGLDHSVHTALVIVAALHSSCRFAGGLNRWQ